MGEKESPPARMFKINIEKEEKNPSKISFSVFVEMKI